MKNITPLISLTLVGLTASLMGEWKTLETFDGSVGLEYDSQKLHSGETTTEYGVMQLIADPTDSSNMVGSFSAGPDDPGNLLNDSSWWATLPETVPDESTASTFYLRVYSPTTNFDAGWSISFTDGIDKFWADNEVLMRITSSGLVEARSVSSQKSLGTVELNTWYEYWIVVNNSANTYQVYARGGHFGTEQILAESELFEDTFNFRLSQVNTFKRFCLNFSTGGETDKRGRDPLYIDDMFYDPTGMNLTTPEDSGEMWGPYTVNSDGATKWVDTGDWMGVLDVTHAMAGDTEWVYSWNLTNWVWLNRDYVAADHGSWVYVP